MRVAVVQEHVDAARGGAETSTLEMAACLAELGLDVTVLSAGREGGSWSWPADVGRAVESCGAGSGGARVRLEVIAVGDRVTKLGRTRAFILRAEQRCRAERFDVVHAITPLPSADVYQPRGGTYAETIARSLALWRSPLTRALRGLSRRLNARQQFLLGVENALLNRNPPPVVAAVSQYVARQVRRAAPALPPQRLRVVFNGVGIRPVPDEHAARRSVRAALAERDETPLLLFVAHNFRLKGLAALLKAMAIAASRGHGWRLLVVGRGRPAAYARLARRFGLAVDLRAGSPQDGLESDVGVAGTGAPSGARVSFLGPRGGLAALYAAADVLVHPTWYDPASRVALEALCCGLPVVTTVFNGAAEVLEVGRTGEIVETPDDAGGLCTAIECALRPQVREACRAAAREMRERLSMSRHARELAALYTSLRS